MPPTTFFANKNINARLLDQELQALDSGYSVSLLGFLRIAGSPVFAPAPSRRCVSTHVSNGEKTEIFADPGEIRLKSPQGLTGPQNAAIADLLAVHDSTQQSAGEVREQQDETDMVLLLQALRDWSSMDNAKFRNAMRRLLRLVLRRERSSEI